MVGPSNNAMRIVLWGTYDTGKPRIRILREGLRATGAEVIELHAEVWANIADKSQIARQSAWLRRCTRIFLAYPRLIWRYLRTPDHDLVLLSYPGQADVLMIKPFAWLRRKPLAYDWFLSAYDTVVLDRQLVSRRNPLAWALWLSDWLAAKAANIPFMDTATHARRMETLFRLREGSVGHVWVGAETDLFAASIEETPVTHPEAPLRVLFYGQFIPLHGVDTIVEAARLTRNEPIEWILIGHGQESPAVCAMLEREPLPKLRRIDWAAYPELRQWIADADVCLGIFGASDKAASVIPNKVFQIIAAGRPLITRDSPAIRELLEDASPCVSLVPAADAQALAAEVRRHMHRARATTLAPCHRAAAEKIGPVAIGRQFQALARAR